MERKGRRRHAAISCTPLSILSSFKKDDTASENAPGRKTYDGKSTKV